MFWHSDPLLVVITLQSVAGVPVRTVSPFWKTAFVLHTILSTPKIIRKIDWKTPRDYSDEKKGNRLFFDSFTDVVHHFRSPVLQAERKEGGDTDTGSNTYSPCNWDKEGVDDGQINEQLRESEHDNDEV